MLRWRLFSYGDAQRYRLGVNHNLIPVNRPRCPFHSFHRDGKMRTDDNYGATLSYEPNSFGEWQDTPSRKEPPMDLHGEVYNYDEREYDGGLLYPARQIVAVDDAEDKQATYRNYGYSDGGEYLYL